MEKLIRHDLVFNNDLGTSPKILLYYEEEDYCKRDDWKNIGAPIVDIHLLRYLKCETLNLPVFRVTFMVSGNNEFLATLQNEYEQWGEAYAENIANDQGDNDEGFIETVDYEEENDINSSEIGTEVIIFSEEDKSTDGRITWEKSWKSRGTTFYHRCKAHAYPTYVNVDWKKRTITMFVSEFKNGRKEGPHKNPLCKSRYKYRYGFYIEYWKKGKKEASKYIWLGTAGYKKTATHKKKINLKFAKDIDSVRAAMASQPIRYSKCPWN